MRRQQAILILPIVLPISLRVRPLLHQLEIQQLQGLERMLLQALARLGQQALRLVMQIQEYLR